MASNQQNWTTYHQIAGAVLRRVRQSLGYSQSEVAGEVGMSQSALSKIEKGSSTLNIARFRKMSLLFGYEPSRILRAIDEEADRLQDKGIMVISDIRPSEIEHREEHKENISASDVYDPERWSPIPKNL